MIKICSAQGIHSVESIEMPNVRQSPRISNLKQSSFPGMKQCNDTECTVLKDSRPADKDEFKKRFSSTMLHFEVSDLNRAMLSIPNTEVRVLDESDAAVNG